MKKIWVTFLLVCLLISAPAFCVPKSNTPVRAFHFVLLNISLEEAKHLVDKASEYQFNTLVLDLLWGASVKLKTFPWTVDTNPWEKEDLLSFVQYAQKHGIRVIPEMHLLSHQQVLLNRYRPDLSYNQQTYDPRKAEVYKILLPMIDEVIDLIHPDAFHIGHDEVVGWAISNWGKFLNIGEHSLPANLFYEDVMIFHQHLRKKNINTWMWGDMLVAVNEVPGMNNDSLHGQMTGYGEPLRKKLPLDIVVCDWHYSGAQRDFLSIKLAASAGHRVLGATWDDLTTTNNFSKYAANHKAEGMILTLWSYVQLKEWGKVDNLMNESGKIFNRDFPN
ncbi:family 20 glycosylhydrolase [Undibacterium sp. RuRC25W]|uniref:family 20 glycosylhydrolase n=1 Tax=Undibacterium sp. RuRC25W TaxID=3413047 RepID=UPI003BF34FEF